MSFKSQKEIWEHLIAGGKVAIKESCCAPLFLSDKGELRSEHGPALDHSFSDFADWQIYQEPKLKRKITLYRYTYEFGASCKGVEQSSWSDSSWGDVYSGTSRKLLMTESKEIEVDP